MGLAEGVTAGNQRHGLLVIHRHAKECFADVLGRREWIRLAVRPRRIDVDQAHLHGAKRTLKLTLAAIALVAEPRSLRPPIELLGFPDVGAAAAETEGLKTHRVQRDVAGQHHQVGPGDFPAVFLLDWPEQPARLVEVRVIRPAVEWRETLLAGTGAAAAVGNAVGARAVPRHADEQAAVMAEVGGPPRLRVRHQGMQVFDHRIQIETLEFLGVVELLTHRIGQGGVAVETLKAQLVRPPVAVRVGLERAFARALVIGFRVHVCLRSCSFCFSRFVYKYRQSLESDPAAWPAMAKRWSGCLIAGAAMRAAHSRTQVALLPVAGFLVFAGFFFACGGGAATSTRSICMSRPRSK